MDCAKGINFLYSCGGRMQDYWGIGKATGPMLPMIAVPTTAGTGSEAQSFALISDAETHVKMACGDKRAACRIALLDPTLTVTQPQRVTALTGIDADRPCARNVRHDEAQLHVDLVQPRSVAAARDELRRRCSATRPISKPAAACNSARSSPARRSKTRCSARRTRLANPLTAHYDMPHGQAIALMLPHVIRFNGDGASRLVLRTAGLRVGHERRAAASRAGPTGLADFLAQMAAAAGLADQAVGVRASTKQTLPQLAEDAAKQWTGTFNPRKVGAAELLELYRAAY